MCAVLLEDVEDVFLNSFCFGFRLFDTKETNGLFLSDLFRSPTGCKLLHSLGQGATRYNLSKRNFLRIELNMPQLDEQSAIATVLSDMDSEIVALEQKRDKTKLIKQGMMQKLLAGRTRLI